MSLFLGTRMRAPMVRVGKPFYFTSSYAPARLIPSTDATSGTESIRGKPSKDVYSYCFIGYPFCLPRREAFCLLRIVWLCRVKTGTSPWRGHLLPGDLLLVIVRLVAHGEPLLLVLSQLLSICVVGHRCRVMHRSLVYRTFHSAYKVTKMIDKTVSATVTTLYVTISRRDSCVRS